MTPSVNITKLFLCKFCLNVCRWQASVCVAVLHYQHRLLSLAMVKHYFVRRVSGKGKKV
jgi:hypothetical protein